MLLQLPNFWFNYGMYLRDAQYFCRRQHCRSARRRFEITPGVSSIRYPATKNLPLRFYKSTRQNWNKSLSVSGKVYHIQFRSRLASKSGKMYQFPTSLWKTRFRLNVTWDTLSRGSTLQYSPSVDSIRSIQLRLLYNSYVLKLLIFGATVWRGNGSALEGVDRFQRTAINIGNILDSLPIRQHITEKDTILFRRTQKHGTMHPQ